MRLTRIGAGIFVALLVVHAEARATFGGSGFGGGAPTIVAQVQPNPGGIGKPPIIFGKCVPGDGTGCRGGFAGASGPCGFAGAGGCFGSGMVGMCGFSGSCFGSFSFPQPTQTYSRWAPSPGKAYYHRTLTVQTPPPNEAAVEFVLVHYPDRPKFFYYYDPVEKKYFGRYRIGATPTDCFQVLVVNDRKVSIKDIKESAFRNTGGMPILKLVIQPKSSVPVDPALQNVKLLRPPESIPDELLGLPPEEPALKKGSDKK